MTITLHPYLDAQLTAAVYQARHARHQPDCHCGAYRHNGAPFCSPEEWRHSTMLDRILGQIERLNSMEDWP